MARYLYAKYIANVRLKPLVDYLAVIIILSCFTFTYSNETLSLSLSYTLIIVGYCYIFNSFSYLRFCSLLLFWCYANSTSASLFNGQNPPGNLLTIHCHN